MNLNIREAVHRDIPVLVKLATLLSLEDGGLHGEAINHEWAPKHGAESFTHSIDSSTSGIWIAEVDGEVVGSLHGYIQSGPSWRSVDIAVIITLFVKPNHREHGIGSRLVTEFRAWAEEQGSARMAVSAFASNDRAIRFYKREGFQPFELTLEKAI